MTRSRLSISLVDPRSRFAPVAWRGAKWSPCALRHSSAAAGTNTRLYLRTGGLLERDIFHRESATSRTSRTARTPVEHTTGQPPQLRVFCLSKFSHSLVLFCISHVRVVFLPHQHARAHTHHRSSAPFPCRVSRGPRRRRRRPVSLRGARALDPSAPLSARLPLGQPSCLLAAAEASALDISAGG
jgi:hypothetical protein